MGKWLNCEPKRIEFEFQIRSVTYQDFLVTTLRNLFLPVTKTLVGDSMGWRAPDFIMPFVMNAIQEINTTWHPFNKKIALP